MNCQLHPNVGTNHESEIMETNNNNQASDRLP